MKHPGTCIDRGLSRQALEFVAPLFDRAAAGSMVLDGIVVAVSGADPLYDEVLAGAVALSLRAAMKLREQSRGS